MGTKFKLLSEFSPAGDQPKAIKALVEGFRAGKSTQVLLGATGTGKTFTASNVIKELSRPTLVLAHNKTLAAQLYKEFKSFFQKTRFITLSVIMIIISPRHIFLSAISTSKKTPRSTKILIV